MLERHLVLPVPALVEDRGDRHLLGHPLLALRGGQEEGEEEQGEEGGARSSEEALTLHVGGRPPLAEGKASQVDRPAARRPLATSAARRAAECTTLGRSSVHNSCVLWCQLHTTNLSLTGLHYT